MARKEGDLRVAFFLILWSGKMESRDDGEMSIELGLILSYIQAIGISGWRKEFLPAE
jgi:hypothetical protein